MKSQSLKLFAVTAFVLGLAAIFAAGSTCAQSKISFETPFDFHIGKDKFAAGNYELQKLDTGRYLLRGEGLKEARIIAFKSTERNADSTQPQRITFNRYGENYFLRSLFEQQDADGKFMFETGYEKQIRREFETKENRFADAKYKQQTVSVNLKNKK